MKISLLGSVVVLLAWMNPAWAQPTVQTGFPFDIPNLGTEPTSTDLDGDGLPEILTVTVDGLLCIGPDGAIVPGWTYPQATSPAGFSGEKVLVGDLDGDGQPDIVTRGFTGDIYVMNRLGEFRSGWPIPNPGSVGGGELLLIDTNGDGALEIATIDRSLGDRFVTLLDGDGALVPGWPYPIVHAGPGPIFLEPPAAGDIDFDGKEELVFGVSSTDGFSRVVVLEEGGVLRDGWPAQVPMTTSYLAQLAIGDLDGDYECEIFGYGLNSLSAFNADGSHFWPGFVPPGTAAKSVACADLDGDGQKEVIIIGPSLVRIFATNGYVLRDTLGNGLTGHKGLAIADIDGDGDLEIAFEAVTTTGAPVLSLVDHMLEPLLGFPMVLSGSGGPPRDSTFFADFDGDGDLELGTSTASEIHVFDLPPAPSGTPRVVWQQRGNTARGSAWYEDDKRQYFLRGDATRNSVVDVADAVAILAQLFLGEPMVCESALDTNSSNAVDLSDVVYLLQYLFTSGAEIDAPNQHCVGFPADSSPLSCAPTRCP